MTAITARSGTTTGEPTGCNGPEPAIPQAKGAAMSEMQGAGRSVRDALLGDLDDGTRARYGLVPPGGDGSGPATEGEPRRGLVGIVRETAERISEDRVSAVAGGVTFFALLSLFPAITAFVSLYGLAADPARIAAHLDLLAAFLPEGALQIVRGQVEAIAASSGSLLSLAGLGGLAVALYSANGGMKALLSALNVALFQKETRGFLQLNLVAMCFTLGGLVMVALMLGVIAVIPVLLHYLPLPDRTGALVGLLRWPILFAVLLGAIAALYRWGPARPQRRAAGLSPVLPGALLAGVMLVAASMLFSWYAANFANYNRTYGALGAVIALMMWLWLSGCILLAGAELNAVMGRRKGLPKGGGRPKKGADA